MILRLIKIGIVFVSALLIASQCIAYDSVGETSPCDIQRLQTGCEVDKYVGSTVIFEDDFIRVWNFTLAPGEMTSMHRHDYDYHFVAISPTQLEVWAENGSRLFDFRAEGVLGFTVEGDYLKPTNIELPFPVPRTHSAKNIGDSFYYEILYESKTSLQQLGAQADEL